MPQSISEIIYQAFFEKLTLHEEVKPTTIEALRKLYKNNQITNKQSLAQLVQDMESRYAQNKTTHR